jgi:hypothetical protein
MGITVTGLDELQRRIKELQHRAEELSGTHDVPISQLLTPEFMLLNTDFESVESMFDASKFQVRSQEDFAAIPDERWDEFICSVTRFATWKEMLAAATSEYVSERLAGNK